MDLLDELCGLEVNESNCTQLIVVQFGKSPSAAHTYNYQGVSILPCEGVFCRVVRSGRVRRGDEIALLSSPSPGVLDRQNGAV